MTREELTALRNAIDMTLALPDSLRVRVMPKQMSDDRNLDAVERLLPVAEEAGLSLTHMAMGFVMAHPGVTSAILGPRTMQHLDDLLAVRERLQPAVGTARLLRSQTARHPEPANGIDIELR